MKYRSNTIAVRRAEKALKTLVTAKDLATWIQKEVDIMGVCVKDGELLDYIYDVCKKITEEDNNESKN